MTKNHAVPYLYAKTHHVIVSQDVSTGTLILYRTKDTSIDTLAEITRVLIDNFRIEEITKTAFQQQLATTYQSSNTILDAAETMQEELDISKLASQLPSSEDLLDTQNDAPIITLINALFMQAIQHKASDIHIETYENRVLVRHRIDGMLQEVLEIQRAVAPLVISRVKVMAKLDIAEKRVPQDGRIALRIGGQNIDVRVSTLPSNHGERIVLRILDKQAVQLHLDHLDISAANLVKIRHIIAQPHGVLLVTGPTGSGKTTTLYAMLTELNQVTRNILTIEDPIEYDLPGIGQTQVNTKTQMTFAKGLRAILRQDPDVVMIGEIRDLETAEIAIQASLTGHLVLSTLHTNSAFGALTRLTDVGIEPFLLASSLIGLMAQRLVRKLCPHCKIAHIIREDEYALLGLDKKTCHNPIEIYEPLGCEHCHHGYRGRTGIYEIILFDETLRSMIHRNEPMDKLETYIRPKAHSLREDGVQRVLAGDTSLAEILRVTTA